MATILIKKRDTTGAPSAGDLTNSTGGAELAVNTFDKRLYAKDSGGNVVELGTAPSTVDINAGSIDGTPIGAASPSTGAFTTLSSNSTTTLNGTVIPASKTLLVSTDIGTSVQAYDADTAKYDDTTANFTGTLQNGGSNVVVDTDIGSTVQAYDADTAKYDDTTANFTGTLQNGGSNVLVDTDIGSTVQAYDADTAKYDDATANFTGTLQNGGSNVLVDTDIGSTVQAYDADTAKYDDTTANFTGTLQNGGSNVVVDTDIGSTVLAYDSNLQGFVTAFTLPTTDGTVDQVLKTDGAGNIGFATVSGGGGGLTYVVKTANYTTQNNEGVLADTSGGAFTVTLPVTPSTGDQVVVADPTGDWGTNNLTVARNGSTIADVAQDLVCDIAGAAVQLVYDGTTWTVYAQIGGNGGTAVTLDGTQTLTNKTLGATTLSGTLSAADNVINRPVLEDYAVQGSAIGNTGATRTIDMEVANFFSATLDQACTFTFSNPPASGDFGCFILELTNGGAYVATWPASVDWPGGTAPTLTSSGVDQLVFTTRDGGTTYFGFVAGLDIKSP